jgi:hypothetical protein
VGLVRTTAFAVFCFVPLLAGSAAADEARFIALASEPIRAESVPAIDAADASSVLKTLHEAISANDLPRFQAALTRAREIADGMPLGDARNALRRSVMTYEDVATVWSFAATDRFGAFYNDDAVPGLYDKLAADYPGYAHLMEDARIVDAHGITWYPTSETRAFLLQQIVPPHAAPSPVKVAQHRSSRPHRAHPPRAAQVATPPVQEIQPLPIPDALASDLRNAAKPPAAIPVPAPEPVRAQLADDGGGSGTLLFMILGLLAAGVISLFVRMPLEDEPEERADEEPVYEAEVYELKQTRAS